MFFPANQLLSEIHAIVNIKLTKAQRDKILAPYYQAGERIVQIALLIHFGLALCLATFYETWFISIAVSLFALAMFFLCSWAFPRTMITRCIAGVSLQIFVALHIYQLHGLEEMHFFFFTSFVVMIALCDPMAMWPGTLFIILQHIWFAWLTNSGVEMYFFPTKPVGFWKLVFHFGIAIVFVGICGIWAALLRFVILRESLQRSAATRLAAIAEQTSNAVILTDLSGRITWANDSFLDMVGYRFDEVIGRSLSNFVQTDHNVDLQDFLGNEVRYIRRDGQKYWLKQVTSPIVGEAGEPQGYITVSSDITQQRLATLALHESESRFRQLAEHLEQVFWIYDAQSSTYLYISPAFETIWGRSLPTEQRLTIEDVWLKTIHPDDQPEVGASLTEQHHRESTDLYYRIVRPDGSVRYIHDRGYAIRNAQGRITRMVGIAEDITERRVAEQEQSRLQERIQNAQRLESLGILAGGIAHDFNNLLTVILGSATMARESLDDPKQLDEILANIETTTQRAADLTKQILAYAGKGRFVVETINLSVLVKEMSVLLNTQVSRRATLQLDLASELPAIVADATQIRQVVLNLITNAVEAVDGRPNGLVQVKTTVQYLQPDQLHSPHSNQDLPGGQYVCLEVVDNGCGMSQETLQRIFDPFFTTKFTGRGLGLAAVLGIVRGHNGSLLVQSELGKGSRFTVYFPVKPDSTHLPTQGPPSGVDLSVRFSGTVLVAEDDESIRAITVTTLAQQGFEVLQAADGQDGCELFAQHADRIRLVILDMIMPRCNGIEMLRFIRQIRRDVPVLLISGYSEQEVKSQIGDEFISGFLPKPFRVHEILKAVQKILRKSSTDAILQN